MPRWALVEQEAPSLAETALRYLLARTHLTLATLRKDGSPRISGIELRHADGELWLGMMGGSVKAADLRRDPRFALHSGSDDPPAWTGDAKIAGRAEEIGDRAVVRGVLGADHEGSSAELFRLDVLEVVVVRLGDPPEHLVVESWHHGRGTRRQERR
jgi:Pyridoxamine 5'-phosphate oxidase